MKIQIECDCGNIVKLHFPDGQNLISEVNRNNTIDFYPTNYADIEFYCYECGKKRILL